MNPWTIDQSRTLYNIEGWGAPYFDINAQGNITVSPDGTEIKQIDLAPIVIDDGSTDRTYEIAKKMNIVVIKHSENKGKGEALKTGFNFILKNLPKIRNVVIVDADMQYSPKDSIKILDPLIKPRGP